MISCVCRVASDRAGPRALDLSWTPATACVRTFRDLFLLHFSSIYIYIHIYIFSFLFPCTESLEATKQRVEGPSIVSPSTRLVSSPLLSSLFFSLAHFLLEMRRAPRVNDSPSDGPRQLVNIVNTLCEFIPSCEFLLTGRVHPSGTRARPRASIDSNDSSPVSRIPDILLFTLEGCLKKKMSSFDATHPSAIRNDATE